MVIKTNMVKFISPLVHPKFHVFLGFMMVLYSGYASLQPLAMLGGVIVAISVMRMAFMDKYCDTSRTSIFKTSKH